MNFGIITLHKSINYGAVLQTYALSQSVKKLIPAENEVFVFDHVNAKIEKYESLLNFGSNIKSFILRTIMLPDNVRKKIRFNSFSTRKLDLRPEYTDEDCFIAGSDQIWNYNCTGCDKAYFLDFVKNPRNKNSYAASFGTDSVENRYRSELSGLLADFNKISVREIQGQRIIKSIAGRDVPVVLDPTLLLDAKEWEKAAAKTRPKSKYILFYTLMGSHSIYNFANELSKQTGLKIICITNTITARLKNCRYQNGAGPSEWLSLFLNASYIVTNSFHGTAFAINFNKPFFTELLPPPAPVNSRLENLLDLFGLRGRQIIDGKNSNINEPIDYNRVNRILSEEKNKSIEYLKSIIEAMK